MGAKATLFSPPPLLSLHKQSLSPLVKEHMHLWDGHARGVGVGLGEEAGENENRQMGTGELE